MFSVQFCFAQPSSSFSVAFLPFPCITEVSAVSAEGEWLRTEFNFNRFPLKFWNGWFNWRWNAISIRAVPRLCHSSFPALVCLHHLFPFCLSLCMLGLVQVFTSYLWLRTSLKANTFTFLICFYAVPLVVLRLSFQDILVASWTKCGLQINAIKFWSKCTELWISVSEAWSFSTAEHSSMDKTSLLSITGQREDEEPLIRKAFSRAVNWVSPARSALSCSVSSPFVLFENNSWSSS